MESLANPLRVLALDMEFSRLLPDSWGTESSPAEREAACQDVRIVAASCCCLEGTRVSNRVFRSLAPLHLNTNKVEEMAHFVLEKHEEGFVIVTWGGMAADFRVFCANIQDPQLKSRVRDLAKRHVDIALCILATSGMMVGLESCAAACLCDKGSGKETPSKELCELWQRGGADSLRVVRHVEDDAFVTARLYRFVVESQQVNPRTYTGFRKRVSMKSPVQPGGAWVAWETTRSDRTMVVPLPLSQGRPQDVAACRAIKRTFAWKPEPPFTVESCCAWADV